jgi:putative spermidine/putrescine transport system substrate-binding protein
VTTRFKAALAGLALAVAIPASAFAADSNVTLNIGSYGGVFTDVTKKFVGDLFTEQTGVKVNYIDASPATHLAKLIAAKGREAPYDLVYLDGDVESQAITAGVLAKLDPKSVPNLKFVYPALLNKDRYSPAVILTSIAIAYNADALKAHGIPAPKSWADLWDPRLAGHVSVPSIDNVMGRVFILAAAKLVGAKETDLDPAIDKIASLKVESYYISSTALEAKFQSGDVWVAPWINGRAWGMAMRGQPIRFVIPSEGGYADIGTLDVTAGSKHKAEAQAYLNWQLDPLPQLVLPYELRYGPANRLLSSVLKAYPQLAQQFPSSPEDLDHLNQVDWAKFWPQYPHLLDLWNHKLLNQ